MDTGMSLRHWEIVRAVISTGSVTRASRVLGISQPSVSQALRHAEDQLGFKLFNRVNGRMQATFETSLLAPEIEHVFERVGAVGQIVRELRESKAGHVNVATIPALATALLPSAIARFRKEQPAVRVRVQVLSTNEVLRLVAHHLVDVGLIHTAAVDRDVQIEEILRTEIVCAMAPTHPLASEAEITPARLRGYPVIAARQSLDAAISNAFRAVGETPDLAIEINHSLTACALAAQGVGVALVDPFVLPLSTRLVSRPFRPVIPLSTRILSSERRPLSRLVLQFLDDLRQSARTFSKVTA